MADVNIKQLIKDVSLNTKEQYMKEYMKESNTLAENKNIKQLSIPLWQM